MISTTLRKNLKVYRYIYDIQKKYGYQLFQIFLFQSDVMMMIGGLSDLFLIIMNAEKHELFYFFALLRPFFFYFFLLHIFKVFFSFSFASSFLLLIRSALVRCFIFYICRGFDDLYNVFF